MPPRDKSTWLRRFIAQRKYITFSSRFFVGMLYQNFCLLGTRACSGHDVQFAILMDKRPWRLLAAVRGEMGWLEHGDVVGGFRPGGRWREININGNLLQDWFNELEPGQWRRDTDVFKPDEIRIPRHGRAMTFLWKNGKRLKSVTYWINAYPTVERLNGYESLERYIKYLRFRLNAEKRERQPYANPSRSLGP